MIEAIQLEFPGYGYRRVQRHIARQGLRINGKRIRRVMSQYGLLPVVWKSFVRTTDSCHRLRIYENLLKDRQVEGLNEAWVSDITYIRIETCFVYLAVIMDLYSRRVIGWAISRRLDRQLCLEALEMALRERNPAPGCIHHSDRGVQYAPEQYVQRLRVAGFQISMSAKANPYDNAFMESFFKTLKYEEVHLWNYDSYQMVIDRVPYFIEEVYNKKRLHSALGYIPPNEFEEKVMRERTSTFADQTVLNTC